MSDAEALLERRLNAYRNGGGLDAMVEATTLGDVQMLNEAFANLDPEARLVADLYADLRVEFARGKRCSVCGRTAAQSALLGYDCAREC
jgi:hypothetical protein